VTIGGVISALSDRFPFPKRPAPVWHPTGEDGGAWAELLSTSPLIIHTLPSVWFPLGAASAVGPMLRRRAVNFIVMLSWTIEPPGQSERLAQLARSYLADHTRHSVTFLCNVPREAELMSSQGFPAECINHNCLVDDSVFKPMPQVESIYDAVYNARLSPGKRHELAKDIESLALIFYFDHETPDGYSAVHAQYAAMLPTARFINSLTPNGWEWLSGQEINRVLAQSRVGLCLSKEEGAMRASIEYLLAGLSLVSTPSIGGRDYFFDDEFCIVCEPDPRNVREAVDALVARNIPRDYVRGKTLARVNRERQRYIAFVQGLIENAGGNTQFEDRFWELTRGPTILHYRSMTEFRESVAASVRGDRRRFWAGITDRRTR
jgi:glycosyltransferase involved in cell wall biosynthesis